MGGDLGSTVLMEPGLQVELSNSIKAQTTKRKQQFCARGLTLKSPFVSLFPAGGKRASFSRMVPNATLPGVRVRDHRGGRRETVLSVFDVPGRMKSGINL